MLHACAHNPTGVDPTIEQWKEIRRETLAGKGHVRGVCVRERHACSCERGTCTQRGWFGDKG
eukprot:50300-Rhodomonas_salina.2